MKRYKEFVSKFLILAFLTSCELSYEPTRDQAVPCNQATPWTNRGNGVKKAEPYCFSLSELSQEIPISKILDIALFNNPRTQVSWQAARAAAYGFRASLSPYYPTVTFNETLEVENNTIGAANGVNITTTTSGASAATLGPTVATLTSELIFSYLLFDFGGREAQVEFAGNILFAANWQHNLDIQQVILTVLTAYTSYLNYQGLVEANRQDLKDAEKAVDAAEKMFAAGLVTKTDVLQAKATRSQRQLAVIQSENAESTALGQLAVAMGLPPDTKLSVVNLPQQLPLADISGDIAELFEVAKKHRPDLGIAVAAIREQEAQLKIAISASLPQLSAFGSLNHTHFIHRPRLDGHDNILGLQLNAPIFQGFYFVNQQKQIRAQIAQAAAALDLQVTQVALDILSSYYALKTAVEQIPTTIDFLDFSERAYLGVSAQYKVGTSTIIDVLNALTVLSNARAAIVTARTSWAASRANLAFAVGILNDTDLQEVSVKMKERSNP